MSDTPRTDAIRLPSEALLPATEKHLGPAILECIKILGEHARTLERELAAREEYAEQLAEAARFLLVNSTQHGNSPDEIKSRQQLWAALGQKWAPCTYCGGVGQERTPNTGMGYTGRECSACKGTKGQWLPRESHQMGFPEPVDSSGGPIGAAVAAESHAMSAAEPKPWPSTEEERDKLGEGLTPAAQQAGVNQLRNTYWTNTPFAHVCAIYKAMSAANSTPAQGTEK